MHEPGYQHALAEPAREWLFGEPSATCEALNSDNRPVSWHIIEDGNNVTVPSWPQNTVYLMQYSRITADELRDVINNR